MVAKSTLSTSLIFISATRHTPSLFGEDENIRYACTKASLVTSLKEETRVKMLLIGPKRSERRRRWTCFVRHWTVYKDDTFGAVARCNKDTRTFLLNMCLLGNTSRLAIRLL